MRLIFMVAWLLLFLPGGAAAADPVDYLREVKPLLAARCYACWSTS